MNSNAARLKTVILRLAILWMLPLLIVCLQSLILMEHTSIMWRYEPLLLTIVKSERLILQCAIN